jgi:hypothetical protein
VLATRPPRTSAQNIPLTPRCNPSSLASVRPHPNPKDNLARETPPTPNPKLLASPPPAMLSPSPERSCLHLRPTSHECRPFALQKAAYRTRPHGHIWSHHHLLAAAHRRVEPGVRRLPLHGLNPDTLVPTLVTMPVISWPRTTGYTHGGLVDEVIVTSSTPWCRCSRGPGPCSLTCNVIWTGMQFHQAGNTLGRSVPKTVERTCG